MNDQRKPDMEEKNHHIKHNNLDLENGTFSHLLSYVDPQLHTCTTHIHIHLHKHMHIYVYTCTTHMHIHLHKHMHIYVHTYALVHMYTGCMRN